MRMKGNKKEDIAIHYTHLNISIYDQIFILFINFI